VLVSKGFRFRIYPTREQAATLVRWESTLRFLWNIANEQRLIGLARPRGEKKYVTAFDQINELTGLRAEFPWIAEVPRNVCAQLLTELDAAWQRCFFVDCHQKQKPSFWEGFASLDSSLTRDGVFYVLRRGRIAVKLHWLPDDDKCLTPKIVYRVRLAPTPVVDLH
jgi:transposase